MQEQGWLSQQPSPLSADPGLDSAGRQDGLRGCPSPAVLLLLAVMQEQSRQTTSEGSSKLAAVLRLEAELQAEREQASVREGELRGELERLRREKRESEARLGGQDLAVMEVRAEHDFLQTLS